jgi:glycerol-3-phosphate dehydrogenase (NAD(P)+)
MRTVAVLGGGSFGTALAELTARRGFGVRLWMRDGEAVRALNRTHKNPRYLSQFELHRSVVATDDLKGAVSDAAWVLVAVPSHSMRGVLTSARGALGSAPIVLAAKGIENETLMTMDEVATDTLGAAVRARLLTLSGPSFAREIVAGQPTAVVLACADEPLAREVASDLFSDTFRAYTSSDVIGVEMGGALKNVMAIASGVVSGLGLGDNTRAAIVTRGLAEITRLAVAKGAHPMTLAGLSGVGDLVLTCTGGQSRNRTLGQLMGEGKTLEQALAQIREVVEGVNTARSAHLLAQKLGVEARITRAVYQGLFEGVSVREAVAALVRRPPGSEREF